MTLLVGANVHACASLKHRWLDFASARAVGDLPVCIECLMQGIH